MNQFSLRLLCISLGLSLTACASISEKDCLQGDWYEIGLKDGRHGSHNRSASYSKDCAEYQVQVDAELYKKGREKGLKSYCTYEKGVSLGSSNRSYNNVCPAELAPEFLSGYQPYRNVAKAKAELHSVEYRVEEIREKLDDEELKEKDRKKIKSKLKSAKAKVKRAKGEVFKYELELILHKVDRETEQLNLELASNDVTPLRKKQIERRLDKLADKRIHVETMQEAGSVIRNLKDLADLF